MPLCPQITNTPITVTQTADFTVTSVVPLISDLQDGLAKNISDIDADAAQAAADAAAALAASAAAQASATAAAAAAASAQANATTALANAATAYNAAVASLQPSANTIVNASNQMTAINGTGITVFSGASATSGARVVLNSLGLAAYGATSSVNITAVSGNGTNVTYTASGHSFTVGQSITVSELAPNGYNGSFVITSVVASTSFTVANTTTATVTDANGVAERATLAISASTGNAVFSGSVTGSTIIGGTLNIAGNAIIDSAGLLTATGATITGTINATAGYFGSPSNGFSINATGLTGVGSGLITGGTIQTSTGTSAVILNGASNALQFRVASVISGNVLPLGTAGILMHYGPTPDSTGTTYPKVQLSFAAAVLQGSASYYVQSTNSGNSALGEFRCFNTLVVDSSATLNQNLSVAGQTFIQDTSTSANAVNARIDVGDGRLRRSTASSARFKEQIVNLKTVQGLEPDKLLQIPVRAFKFKADYLDADDNRFDVMVPGLIAEEVAEHYPAAADLGNDGLVENWNERFIIPGMLALIQDLHKEVQILKGE